MAAMSIITHTSSSSWYLSSAGSLVFKVRHFQLGSETLLRNVAARAWWSSKQKQQVSEPLIETSKPEKIGSSKKGESKNVAKNGAVEATVLEEEVEISWVQEKGEELIQLTGNAINALPGPRVGKTTLPWILAVPVSYFALTFLLAVYRTVRKFNSPKGKRRRLIGRNAYLVKAVDEYFPAKRLEFDHKKLKQLEQKCDFDTADVFRKYIRYALNERQFNPDVVADLLHLRRVTKFNDDQVSDILNDIAERIVKEKGTVIMDLRGFTEKGIKRKAAVQSLFSKLLYLSELEEFCSTARESLKIKEIFGVTDEDANSIRIETLSELSDVESLEKMITQEDDDGVVDNSNTSNEM